MKPFKIKVWVGTEHVYATTFASLTRSERNCSSHIVDVDAQTERSAIHKAEIIALERAAESNPGETWIISTETLSGR